MWDQKINRTDNIYNNPAKFCGNIAMMMGGSASKTNYLLSNTGEKFLPEEKIKMF